MNAFFALHSHALALYDLLTMISPDKQSEAWAEIAKPFLHPIYCKDLKNASDVLMRGGSDARQVKNALSQASLSSVCLFALSIPPSEECHRDVRAIIDKKLQEENFTLEADNLSMLCQKLRPHMQSEALALKMWNVSSLLSDADYEILRSCMSPHESLEQVLENDQSLQNERRVRQLKERVFLVNWITEVDPHLFKKDWNVFFSVPRLLCFALALSQMDAKRAFYEQWSEKLKAYLNLHSLSLAELDRCLANWRHSTRL